ncbi:MAG: TetR/AcrR family transcriptional regulator [Microthrixaceae bacterium]
MTTPTTSTSEPEDTRDRLIEVTVRLLGDGGDHSLRLADVARDASVAVSTIYAHFRDRTDLVAAARLRTYRDHATATLSELRDATQASESADAFREATDWPRLADPTDPEARERRWDQVEAMADTRHLPALAASVGQLQSEIDEATATLVRTGQDVGAIDPALDPSAVALMWQALQLGLAIQDVAGTHDAPAPEAWNQVLERVAQALAGDRVDAGGQTDGL